MHVSMCTNTQFRLNSREYHRQPRDRTTSKRKVEQRHIEVVKDLEYYTVGKDSVELSEALVFSVHIIFKHF